MIYAIVATIILIKVYLYYSFAIPSKWTKRSLDRLASEFGAKLKLFSSFEAQFSGYRFLLKAYSTQLLINLYLHHHSKLKLYILSRSLGPVLFMRRLKNLDYEQEDKFVIYSNDLSQAKNFLNNMHHQDIIANIMENCQFKNASKLENIGDNLEKDLVTLKCDKNKISISFKAREAVLAPKFIRAILKEMIVLSQGL